MTGFRVPSGFDEALRPPVDVRRARLTPSVLRSGKGPVSDPAAQFMRVARRVPEVMVKITGRTRDAGHLKAHLTYISRNGEVSLEGPDGERWVGRAGVRDLSTDWLADVAMEPGRRRDSPVSLAIVLSMPAGTDAGRLHDAARAFASDVFGDRFAYVFALHDEGRHPHVHLTVRTHGRLGERLNPRKADLQVWRETFAAHLRAREVEAEATPRRARGVTLKSERPAIRRMRERFEAGRGPLPDVLASAVQDALSTSAKGEAPWEGHLASRRDHLRRVLLAEAVKLDRAGGEEDRALADAVLQFVKTIPPVETRSTMIHRRLDAKTRNPTGDRSRAR